MSILFKNQVPVPTYLTTVETEYNEIHLISCKKPSVPSYNNSPVKEEILLENSIKEETIEECDLTGDPLKIDLGEDEFIQIDKIELAAPNWTTEETKHVPLTVREARRVLNSILRKPKSHSNNVPIYIVCNGDEPHHTVILGANQNQSMACGVHAVGVCELRDDDIDIDDMVNEHYKRCNRKDIQVKFLTKIKYNLYAKSLRNLPCQNGAMRDLEKHANISVDVTSHGRIFKVLDNNQIDMNMNLELIAGHKLLKLNFLWEELNILQSFIDISRDSLTENTVLCENPEDSDTILQNISNLITRKFLRRPAKNDSLNLDNLRDDDFLDGLWKILKYCENISVLRNSFHFLFEELANDNVQTMNIKDNYSNIAYILNGVLKKNVVLSAITIPQCIELLFELGAQKLKFDFQIILGYFSEMAKNNIDSVWKTFHQNVQLARKSSVRATRVTQCLKSNNIDGKSKQLAYLSQLYVASEFIFLIKDQIKIQEDSFYTFCQHVQKEYVENPNVYEDFLELYSSPLCEISFPLDSKNFEIIKSVYPSRWTMYMTSEVNTTQVITIYDLSDSPIFPPNIYNYDVKVTNKKLLYYMCKINRTKDLF